MKKANYCFKTRKIDSTNFYTYPTVIEELRHCRANIFITKHTYTHTINAKPSLASNCAMCDINKIYNLIFPQFAVTYVFCSSLQGRQVFVWKCWPNSQIPFVRTAVLHSNFFSHERLKQSTLDDVSVLMSIFVKKKA